MLRSLKTKNFNFFIFRLSSYGVNSVLFHIHECFYLTTKSLELGEAVLKFCFLSDITLNYGARLNTNYFFRNVVLRESSLILVLFQAEDLAVAHDV